MVPLCPILSTAEWAGFPDRLEMSCRPQGHAGQRLSLAILQFSLGCGFICVLHSTGQREKASLHFLYVIAACFGLFTRLCSPSLFCGPCEKAQLLMWGIAAKQEEFLYAFFKPIQLFKEEGLLSFFLCSSEFEPCSYFYLIFFSFVFHNYYHK